MQYLNRVHFDAPMTPLELEIYHQMRNVIGIDPAFYEYIFTVDADTVRSHLVAFFFYCRSNSPPLRLSLPILSTVSWHRLLMTRPLSAFVVRRSSTTKKVRGGR